MCGIFFSLSNKDLLNKDLLKKLSDQCSHRGPDNTTTVDLSFLDKDIFINFHRLSINGLNTKSNQPFQNDKAILICNGEIYNYRELAIKYNIDLLTDSDCEIILHLYDKVDYNTLLNELDGVFSFVLFDKVNSVILIGHDPFGVRSLYWCKEDDRLCVASEMKCLVGISEKIEFFPPGSYSTYNVKTKELVVKNYYHFTYPKIDYMYDDIPRMIKQELEKAVDKRMISDRPIGCLLSGGLDSSIIAYLLSQKIDNLKTFSIGLEGSPDLEHSKIVAEYLQTDHTTVIVSEMEMLQAIEKTIQQIESYDTTTIRASVPMYLLSEYIRDNTDIKVIFSGEGSDEASGSYLYFHKAPTPEDFQEECIRLLKDVHYFDVLRGDKTTSGAGLEIRVPFFDKNFMKFYMSIDPKHKVVKDGMEKYLLRKAFETDLPEQVLWRRKDGFSDGVSKNENPWYEIINRYSQENYNLSENEMYQMFYDKYYLNLKTIPYLWLPKWIDESNPSGRLIL